MFTSVQIAPVAVLVPAIAVVGEAAGAFGVFALLGVTSLVTGTAMLLIARLSLARLVRMMPYPVASGFLAASGALLVMAALDLVAVGPTRDLPQVLWAGGPDALLPTLAFGFAALLMLGSWLLRNIGVVFCLVAGVITMHLVVPEIGLSAAQDLGLLYRPNGGELSVADITPAFFHSLLAPDVLFVALPLMLVAVVIGVLGVLLNSSGAELVLNADIGSRDLLNRVGLANLVTGAAGSSVTYISASHSATARRLGGGGLASMIAMIALCLCAVPFATDIYRLVPTFVSGGLLLFSGLGIVNVWFVKQFGRISTTDWVLILVMVTATLVFGVLAAIGIGILAASLIFAIDYARLPVIRSITDLTQRRSTVDRGPTQSAWIEAQGGRVAIVSLQGFLFFGTATQMGVQIRELLAKGVVRHVALDFSRVSRVDASAIAAIRRLEMAAEGHGATLILAGMNAETRSELRGSGLSMGGGHILQVAEGLDDALETLEEILLADLTPSERTETALSALSEVLGNETEAAALLAHMTRESLPEGTLLIRQGDPADDIFIIDTGRLTVRLALPDGRMLKLRTMAAGALVGEIASYARLHRTADVVAQTDVTVYRANSALARTLMQDNPTLAAALHRMVAITLAEKLDRTNKLLGSDG